MQCSNYWNIQFSPMEWGGGGGGGGVGGGVGRGVGVVWVKGLGVDGWGWRGCDVGVGME